jgi:hypothetical protein
MPNSSSRYARRAPILKLGLTSRATLNRSALIRILFRPIAFSYEVLNGLNKGPKAKNPVFKEIEFLLRRNKTDMLGSSG